MARKRRTRQHVIADLSVNYAERFLLKVGHAVNRVEQDYGYDLLVSTYDANGEVENGFILLQLKASDKPSYLRTSGAVSFPVAKADLELWTTEVYPVILILYDAQREAAYWLYVQRELSRLDLRTVRASRAIHIPLSQALDDAAPERFADFKRRIYERLKATIGHE